MFFHCTYTHVFSAFDKWTPQPSDNPEKTPPTKEQGSNNPYAVDIPCEFFAEKYPELVETYAASSRGKKRRGIVA